MFTPSRLVIARQRRAMTVTDLAEATGISRKSLSSYENGHVEPTEETLRVLSTTLDVPGDYFAGPDLEPLDPRAVSFRSTSKRTQRELNTALAAGRFGVELMDWIDRVFELPVPNVPTLSDHDPAVAAEIVRARWGLGPRPVSNMIHLLEYHGVRILRLPMDCATVDAFSFELDGVPYMFLNNTKTPERSRFDAAHELGHLVLHSDHHDPSDSREDEEAANMFASAFLMPRESVLSKPLLHANARQIIQAKQIWNVSAMALVRRLKDLELLTDWRYREACINLARLGYKQGEPEGMEMTEDSLLLTKVVKNLRVERTPLASIASDLRLRPSEIRQFMHGLIPVIQVDRPSRRSIRPKAQEHSLRRVQLWILMRIKAGVGFNTAELYSQSIDRKILGSYKAHAIRFETGQGMKRVPPVSYDQRLGKKGLKSGRS
jgi:Zn-dependent peptidase ImmA (M78 family)/transcriptional regulator with XRE-family HTH domain